jgi:hypothetical protein
MLYVVVCSTGLIVAETWSNFSFPDCALSLSSVTAWDESCRLVYLSRTAAYMRLAG